MEIDLFAKEWPGCRSRKDFFYYVRLFWILVYKAEGCWLWLGDQDRKGYGTFCAMYSSGETPRRISAHRFAYSLHNGTIDPSRMVLHNCDTPQCVRADHLFQGTAKENSQDMARKGRSRFQKLSKKDQVECVKKMHAGRLVRCGY